MRKSNVKKIAAFALAMMMCFGAVGCGAKSDEEKLEEKLNNITEDEFNSLAEEFEKNNGGTPATTTKAEKTEPVETPPEVDTTPASLIYYDRLADEYDSNKGLLTEHTDFAKIQAYLSNIKENKNTEEYKGFYLHGDQIFYTHKRDYDEAADKDAVNLLMDYQNVIDKADEDATREDGESKGFTLEGYLQDIFQFDQTVVDICSYDINAKTTTVLAKINCTLSSKYSCTDIRYAGGYTFVTESHDGYLAPVFMRISPDGTIDIFNDDTTTIDGVSCYAMGNAMGDGSALLHYSTLDEETYQEHMQFALLDSDFETVVPIPAPVKVNEHGTTTAVEWDGTGAVKYANKLFIPALSLYYDLTASEWNTMESQFKDTLACNYVFDVVGKYVISNYYLLDMENNEFILDNINVYNNKKTEKDAHYYFGGNSLLNKVGQKLKSVKVPSDGSDPIEEEIADGVSGTLLSNEYYYVSDEYGYFLHKIGEEGEDPIVTIGAL